MTTVSYKSWQGPLQKKQFWGEERKEGKKLFKHSGILLLKRGWKTSSIRITCLGVCKKCRFLGSAQTNWIRNWTRSPCWFSHVTWLRSTSQWHTHQEAARGGRWHLWKVCSYSPNVSCRSVISGGTLVILRASASCSGLHHDMWITEKACSLWICELAWSSEVFLVMWPLWSVRPHDGEDITRTLCSGGWAETLPRALSHPQWLQHASLVIFIGHDSWGEWGCRLIFYGPIKLSDFRHTGRCSAWE